MMSVLIIEYNYDTHSTADNSSNNLILMLQTAITVELLSIGEYCMY